MYGGKKQNKESIIPVIMVSLLMTSVFQICFSAEAVSINNKEIVDNTQKELDSKKGQPDLIITEVDTHRHLGVHKIMVTVRNIGDKSVTDISLKAVIYQHFILFCIYRKTEEAVRHYILEPGKECDLYFGSPPVSIFGIFKFYCQVYSEGESDYTNNNRSQKFLAFLNYYNQIKY